MTSGGIKKIDVERQRSELHMVRKEEGKGEWQQTRPALATSRSLANPLAAGSLVTANSHRSIPSLYTDVGRLYLEPPLKLPHRALTNQ